MAAEGTLTNFDFLLIIAYFVILVLIGYFASRKQSKEDFLIAERNLGTWKTMFTVNASKTGAILMAIVAATFVFGFAAFWYFIGFIIGFLIFLPFALKLRRMSGGRYYTLADYFKYNYGKKVAYAASFITILIMFGFLFTNLIAATKLFVFFSGWSFWVATMVILVIVLAYIMLAGFRAVVKTDVFQYAAMFVIMVVLAVLLFQGSLIPSSEWDLFSVDGVTVFGFLLIGIMSTFGSPDLWQRVYAVKGSKQLKRGFILSIIVYAFMALLLGMLALTVKVLFPEIDPDFALVHGFATLLPAGLVGLSVILLFAALMSSIDTYIYTASSAFIQDFFNLRKRVTVTGIRITMALITVAAGVVAILIQDILQAGFLFISLGTLLSTIIFATWIKRSITERTLLFGFIIGFLCLSVVTIVMFIQGEIQPTIAIVALGAALLGLMIGGIVSVFKK